MSIVFISSFSVDSDNWGDRWREQWHHNSRHLSQWCQRQKSCFWATGLRGLNSWRFPCWNACGTIGSDWCWYWSECSNYLQVKILNHYFITASGRTSKGLQWIAHGFPLEKNNFLYYYFLGIILICDLLVQKSIFFYYKVFFH